MADDSTRKPTRLVLLDRDGVINHDSPDYIKSADEWQPIDGSLKAIAHLNRAGINTALCSNQAGISRGRLDARALAEIHLRFSAELAREGGHMALWRFCPHHPEDGCSCRKPNNAMLTDCMNELNVEPSAVAFVGDSLKDMQAALKARCLPILVSAKDDPSVREAAQMLGIDQIVENLAAAAERILLLNKASASNATSTNR